MNSQSPLLLGVTALVATAGLFYIIRKSKLPNESTPKQKEVESQKNVTKDETSPSPPPPRRSIRIAFGSQTGTAHRLATLMHNSNQSFKTSLINTSLVNMKAYDVDNLEKEEVIIFVMCTWEGGVPPESAQIFCSWLEDMANDFRVPNTFLSKTSYAVFGLGSSEYAPVDRFCKAALLLDKHMERLGAKRLTPVVKGDASSDIEVQFLQWSENKLWPAISQLYGITNNGILATNSDFKNIIAGGKHRKEETTNAVKWESLEDSGLLRPVRRNTNDHIPLAQYRRNKRKAKRAARIKARAADVIENDEDRLNASLVDLEDLGSVMVKGKASVMEEIAAKPIDRPEMVTPMQRKALTKEGYSIIGTHSAVKLCRWTKHQLRGRGGCYKHT